MTAPLDEARLRELRERALAARDFATQGQWTANPVEPRSECWTVYGGDNVAHCWLLDEETHRLVPLENSEANAAFIAAANPATILALLDALSAERERGDRAVGLLGWYEDETSTMSGAEHRRQRLEFVAQHLATQKAEGAEI